MTFEKRATIEFKDITAVELHCTECGSVAVRKLSDLRNLLPQMCGNCSHVWNLPDSSAGRDLFELLRTLARYAEMKHPYNIRLQINASDTSDE